MGRSKFWGCQTFKEVKNLEWYWREISLLVQYASLRMAWNFWALELSIQSLFCLCINFPYNLRICVTSYFREVSISAKSIFLEVKIRRRSTFWGCQSFGEINILRRSNIQRGKKFGVVWFLGKSEFQRSQNIGEVPNFDEVKKFESSNFGVKF